MVDTGTSSNIVTFWDMTIYNDTLNWWDITLICELVTELVLISDFDLITFREVSIEQLIRYARACSSYDCFILRAARLSYKLFGQGYVRERLKSSLRKFYGRYRDLDKHYGILGHDHIQWHPQLMRYYTNLWTCYRTSPYFRFWPNQISGGFHRTLQRVRLANGGRLLLHAPGPVPFGTCICSNVGTILSWTCHVYGPSEFRTSFGTPILLCAFVTPSPFGFSSFWHFWDITFQILRIWSILLIKSDLKWCITSEKKSIFFNCNEPEKKVWPGQGIEPEVFSLQGILYTRSERVYARICNLNYAAFETIWHAYYIIQFGRRMNKNDNIIGKVLFSGVARFYLCKMILREKSQTLEDGEAYRLHSEGTARKESHDVGCLKFSGDYWVILSEHIESGVILIKW